MKKLDKFLYRVAYALIGLGLFSSGFLWREILEKVGLWFYYRYKFNPTNWELF